ncbi:MAG: sulfurtransferase [bacterium]
MSAHPFYPHVLVECNQVMEWVESGAKVVQVDIDPLAYHHGHVPTAIPWHWETQLRNADTGEILNQSEFEALMSQSGLSSDDKIIVYGDNNNWFACWAFWLLKLFGHKEVYVLDGGLRKWMESGCTIALDEPYLSPTNYHAKEPDNSNKASTEDIFTSFFSPQTHRLVDVRSAAEFKGTINSPGIGTESKCAVGGHIPTAVNIPWNLNCNPDGTFKTKDDLLAMYQSFDILPENTVITYCAIGERASLSWFVLKHLLGYDVVMNFDRSMAFWSRLANAPIEVGDAA